MFWFSSIYMIKTKQITDDTRKKKPTHSIQRPFIKSANRKNGKNQFVQIKIEPICKQQHFSWSECATSQRTSNDKKKMNNNFSRE